MAIYVRQQDCEAVVGFGAWPMANRDAQVGSPWPITPPDTGTDSLWNAAAITAKVIRLDEDVAVAISG